MTPDHGYDERDLQRCFTEPARDGSTTPIDVLSGPGSSFALDRARVLRSAALRSLSSKIQTFELTEGHAPRVRLTHSLEVAQIGREIGESLGADPLLLETAGLAHDLGHPPFGHNGERALDEIAQSCGGFEGNAQTMRILTRLEPGMHAAGGLNLTRAALDAACKYPWVRKPGSRKFGAYQDDASVFAWMREGCPAKRLCLEAQIMDWADDVACAVSDLEDGIRCRALSVAHMSDRHERAVVAQLATTRMTTQPLAEVEHAATDLMNHPLMAPLLRGAYDGTARAQAALHHLAIDLTNRFTQAAVTETRRQYGNGRLTRYNAELCVPGWARAQVTWFRALNLHYVLHEPARQQRRRHQREMLAELYSALHDQAPEALDPASARAWASAGSDNARVRIVVDSIAAMTEPEVVDHHERLLGRMRHQSPAAPGPPRATA